MLDLEIFIAKDGKWDHSHPFWYLGFSYGTKNCKSRLVGDIQNAATKAMHSYCNYTNGLTCCHGSTVSIFLSTSPYAISWQYPNPLNVQFVDQCARNCPRKRYFLHNAYLRVKQKSDFARQLHEHWSTDWTFRGFRYCLLTAMGDFNKKNDTMEPCR